MQVTRHSTWSLVIYYPALVQRPENIPSGNDRLNVARGWLFFLLAPRFAGFANC